MAKCQIQIESYEKGESDQLDQQVFDLDRDGILDALMHMREVSAEHKDVITHFDVQIICGGNYYDSTSVPPFMGDYQHMGIWRAWAKGKKR